MVAGAVVVALTELTRPLVGALVGLVLVLLLLYFALREGLDAFRDVRAKEKVDEEQARYEEQELERRRRAARDHAPQDEAPGDTPNADS